MKKAASVLCALALILGVSLSGCGEKTVSIELTAENADLSMAPDIVLEPDKAPYNLGGWRQTDIASWEVEIPEDGTYDINILYSRPGGDWGDMAGVVALVGEEDSTPLSFMAKPTGANGDDWSKYEVNDSCGLTLTKGTYTLYLMPDEENTDPSSMTDHFINLRSVTLVLDR